MKKIVFLAHDPGGYDVIYPVVESFISENIENEFFCVGPAARINPRFAVTEDDIKRNITSYINNGVLNALVTGTSWGNDLENQVRQMCNDSIKTVSILDYWSNYNMRFKTSNDEFIYPEYLIVMDFLAEKEAAKDGVPASIVKVLGHPGLDKYINYKHNNNLSTKENILFISQPLSLLYGESLGYTEWTAFEGCLKLGEYYGYDVSIKFHPKDSETFKHKYSQYSAEGDLDKLLCSYAVIMGMSSMALLHSVLLDKKTLVYQPNLSVEDACITDKLGLTELNTNFAQLKESFLQANEKFSKGKLREYVWSEGKSCERISSFLKKFILGA